MFLKHVVVPRRILSVGLLLKDDNLSFSGIVFRLGKFHETIDCSVL